MSPIAAIFLIVLVDVCAYTLVIPLLPLYAERLHATPLDATLLVSTFAFFQLVSGPVLGRISDKVGRKPVLVVSQIGTLIGLLVLAWAKSLWVVYLARVIDGVTAGNISLAQAYISDHTAPKDRAKSLGKIYIAFGIGFFVGPLSTGLLAPYGIAAPIYAGSALSLLSIIVTLVLLPSEKGQPKWDAHGNRVLLTQNLPAITKENTGYLRFFKKPVLGGIFAETFFFGFCFATFTSGIALFDERRFEFAGHGFGQREVAFHFAFIGFLGITLQALFIGRLVKKFGEPNVVRAGFIALVIGYTGLAFVEGIPPLAVVTMFTVFGHGVLRPALTSLATQNAGKGEQGVVLGIAQSLGSISQIGAPALSGLLIDRGHLGVWALTATGVALLGLIASRWGSRRHAARQALETGHTVQAMVAPIVTNAPATMSGRFAAMPYTATGQYPAMPPRPQQGGSGIAVGFMGIVAVAAAVVAVVAYRYPNLREAAMAKFLRQSPPGSRTPAEVAGDPVGVENEKRTKAPPQVPEPKKPKKR